MSTRTPAEIQDEKRLIRECQEGVEPSFQKLFEKYQRRAYAVAYNILNDAELAKDVVQEAFIRVFKNIRRFDATKNFYTWLYQIVVNLSIDFLRKRASSKAAPLDELGDGVKTSAAKPGGPADLASRDELKKRVREMLDLLPGKYKVVLALRDIEGFSCEEISEIVHCKNSTVRWRIHQARKLFKSLWNGEGVSLKDYYEGNDDDL
jgi:RNA polymerase sigma-70 factor (ECF subfamily)